MKKGKTISGGINDWHGFYPDLQMEVYHGGSEISSTNLRDAESSVALGIHKKRNPSVSTQAMINGTAGHFAIQEPAQFSVEYVPAPSGIDRRTKAGKQEYAEFQEACGDATILEPEIYEACQIVSEKCWKHPEAKHLLEAAEFEISGFASIEDLPCKARPDLDVTDLLSDLVDIKTRQLGAASRDVWLRDFVNHKVYLQAGLQIDIWRELGCDVEHYWYLLVELAPPYQVNLLPLDQEWIALAVTEARGACRRWKAWLDNRGEDSAGPGYPTGQAPLAVPGWVRRKFEESENGN